MTQQLTLWDSEALLPCVAPRLIHFAWASAAIALGVSAVALHLGWTDARLKNEEAHRQLAASRRVQALTARLAELDRQLDSDPQAHRQIEMLREQLAVRRASVVRLQEGMLPQGRRFSDALRGLARLTPDGVVLTEVALGPAVRVSGYASRTDVLNGWLKALAEDAVWSHLRWTHITAQADTPAVRPGGSSHPPPPPETSVQFGLTASGSWASDLMSAGEGTKAGRP